MLHLRSGAALCALALALLPPPGLRAQAGQPFEPRYDLTANGAIDSADASVAASGWSDLAGASPCAPGALAALDLNGDGCVEVADVQLLAAHVGASTPEARPQADPGALLASIWTVDSAGAEPDAQAGDGVCRTDRGRCTLRAAIQEANHSHGPDTIAFDVRNGDGSCPTLVTIAPDSETYGQLTLDDPRGDGTTIDGYTQCGARPNSGPQRGDAVIKVELRGSLRRDIHGLRLLSANNVVRGLALYSWDRQIEVYGGRARYNQIEGNFIGTNAAQSFTSSGLGTHHSEGIRFQIGASYNILGCGAFSGEQFTPCADPGQAAAARNIIAGNGNDGIHLERQAYHNHIAGNYIGLKQDGATALRNSADGVDFEQGPQHNWLGGLTPLERNVISGSGSDGIEISHGTWTQFNHVAGNYFGLDASGTKAVPNRHNGISFEDTVDQNYAYDNVVSGNGDSGFRFYVLATRNVVRNNVVGLAADGQTPLPNGNNGVYVMGGSQRNLLVENIIAHNLEHGIYLASTSDSDHNGIGETYYNTISRNRIFNNGRQGISFFGKQNIYPNQNLAAPRLLRASTLRVEGAACAGCRIEVFLADKATLAPQDGDHSGEGREFVGEGMADGAGNFSVAVRELALDEIVTVTATDVEGNTSMFARNIAVSEVAIPDPTPAPTLTPTLAPATPTASPTASPEPTATTAPGEAPPESRLWLPLLRR